MTLQLPVSAVPLEMRVAQADGRTVVALRGELDAATAPLLSAKFTELSRNGVCDVDLNLAELEFMDSSGLSVVIAEHKRTRAEGGGLIILSPRRSVIRLFQAGGLMSYLIVQPRMSI